MSSTPPTTPTTATTTKRRSARVQKRDPVVAPGFGTYKDLTNLSNSLGLPVAAVQAIMESRGRGIRGRNKDQESQNKEPPTPISTAWADFMTEEGMGAATSTTVTQPEQGSSGTTTTTTTTQPTTETKQRDYLLPLVKDWLLSQQPVSKKAKKSTFSKENGHVLVQTGTLDSTMIGRTKRPLNQPFDLIVPTSILPSLQVTQVIASCNSAHAICIDTFGKSYGWGRNEANQLTQSLPSVVPLPTLLELDSTSSSSNNHTAVVVVGGAVGKSHTLLLTNQGTLHAVGSNKCGQCGVRNFANVPNFRKCSLGPTTIVQVSCGEDFSVALSEDGHVYTTGNSEFGQLGNGETGEYIVTAGKTGFANCNVFTKRNVYCHVPGEAAFAGMSGGNDTKIVPMTEEIRIGYIACGKHHTVAIEAPSDGETPRVWTWGCGNYGCLGHGVQQDEYHPRLVATLSAGPLWKSNPPVRAAAGASCSMILTERGHVYYCGRHRSVGEAVMRPTMLEALANNGHVVTHVAAGSSTVVCSTANAVTISWGMGPHGELGYGEKKSSSKPDFIQKLDSCRIRDLACGQGITLFVIANEDEDDKKAIKQLPVLDPKVVAALEKE